MTQRWNCCWELAGDAVRKYGLKIIGGEIYARFSRGRDDSAHN